MVDILVVGADPVCSGDKTYTWDYYFVEDGNPSPIGYGTTTQDASGNIVFPEDFTTIESLLRLNEDQIPLLIVPVSK